MRYRSSGFSNNLRCWLWVCAPVHFKYKPLLRETSTWTQKPTLFSRTPLRSSPCLFLPSFLPPPHHKACAPFLTGLHLPTPFPSSSLAGPMFCWTFTFPPPKKSPVGCFADFSTPVPLFSSLLNRPPPNALLPFHPLSVLSMPSFDPLCAPHL